MSLEKSHPHLKDFNSFLLELNKESERGVVLISCSFLDNQLRQIISSFLLDDGESIKLVEGFNAPLGTLSSRITAAYSMGLINKPEFKECSILRKVRNVFAHETLVVCTI